MATGNASQTSLIIVVASIVRIRQQHTSSNGRFLRSFSCSQLGFFVYHSLTLGPADPAGPVPIDSMFIYRPDKRQEVWRFLFYMVLHAG